MVFISKRNKRWEREKQQALNNRLELGWTKILGISLTIAGVALLSWQQK